MADVSSNIELAERAATGDPGAFWSLVEPFDRTLRALAYRILGDRDRMDDALQDAYLRAFRALDSFHMKANLGTWLYRIVYNACVDQVRRERRRSHVSLDDTDEAPGPEPDPADVASARHDLAAALASLPPDMRAAVLLVDGEGCDHAEAAEIMHVAVGTVASRLHRARGFLRRALDGSEEG